MHSTQHYGGERDHDTRIDPEVTVSDGEGDGGSTDDQSPFARGENLGRYVVLDTLGRGGMGIVLSAYDSKLDRKVALKVLRPHAAGDADNYARLVREAQALAKLSHPCVVSVYDVGELRGQVFIAMEFIDGPNLRRWTHEEKRTIPRILAVFRDAGRGLQAAHDAGIVHRDFKPDNVLIGSDGRARVTDFGLALEASVASSPASFDPSTSDSVRGSGRLTETGMVMGTPAYMPIEQHVGHVTDHRSDQFSFCVSLYEALYGVRPFSGNTANEYCLSIRRAEIPPPPRDVKVPRRLHQAILRGLAAKPEERHASMRALLRAMTPPTRDGRTWLLGGLGGLALGAGVVVVASPPDQACSTFDERIAEVYGKDHAREILAAFTATGLPYAQAAYDSVTGTLDDFAARWTGAAQEACLATERGEQSEHMLDLRMHCLDRARARLAATVEVLREADEGVVGKASSLAASQAELELCSDLDVLERTWVLPASAEEARESQALFEVLDRVETIRAAGHKEEAKLLFAEREARLDASSYPPIQARALWIQGRLLGTDNDAEAAISLFERAHLLALEHGLDDLGALSASSLAHYIAEFRVDLDLAEHYSGIAMALAEASGSTRVQASVLGKVADLRQRQSRFQESIEAAERALALASQGEHPNQVLIAETKIKHAYAIRLRDGPIAALPELYAIRDSIKAGLGTPHPTLVQVYGEIGNALQEIDEHDECYVARTAAIEQVREVFGEGSLDETYALLSLATALGHVGRKDEALALFAKVDAAVVDALGADHPLRAGVFNNMASIYSDLDQWDQARQSFGEALRIAQANANGPSDTVVLTARNLALAHIYAEDPEQARPLAELSLAQSLEVFGPKHMHTSTSHAVLGHVHLLEKDYANARAQLERAIEIGHDSGTEDAANRFSLARALVEDPSASDEDRARGMRMARAAEKVLAAGQDVEGTHQELLEWLDEHQEGFNPG